MKKTLFYIFVVFAMSIFCIFVTKQIVPKTQVLKYGIYIRSDSSTIGYVVINRSNIGGGQQIIARNAHGELIDRGVIRFKNDKGIINLNESSRDALWVNKTSFTTDDKNVVWVWTRNLTKKELKNE